MAFRRYPRRLSSGANNTVIVLSEAEVGKLFSNDTRTSIGDEAEKLKFANQINSLVPRFVRLDVLESPQSEMLVMERIYPVDYRAFEVERRELWLDVFRDELAALHQAGFVHHDLRRPSGEGGHYYDNILLTNDGLRLIDVGISSLRERVGEKIFALQVKQELEELERFAEYFLNR